MGGGRKWIYKQLLPHVLRKADIIVCISNYVRDEVKTIYPYTAQKLTTVYNSVDIHRNESDSIVKGKYILYVNSLLLYKNVGTLVKAFAHIYDKIPHKLVVVGKSTDYWKGIYGEYSRNKNLAERIVLLENIEDEELASLYSHADLFVTTSLFEGFGFTPIEAAICGARVISTEETALPETTKGLLNYYRPANDYHELAAGILEQLSEEINQKKQQEISQTLAASYDVHRCAGEMIQKILDAYHRRA